MTGESAAEEPPPRRICVQARAVADISIRSKMATASKRIARLKRIDRAAVFVITLGGLSVVVGVLGILVFIAAEALPMFRSAGFWKSRSFPTKTTK